MTEPGKLESLETSLKQHYTSLDWTRTVMLPWMEKDKYPSIDDFYVLPTINITYTSIETTNPTRYIDSYDDLFYGLKPQRLLLQGPPGYGKTVFVHKLAHDWAFGNLIHFDYVFVLKLRECNSNDTIESAILDQFSLSEFSVEFITRILKTEDNKTLVILDALDEITIENHIQIRKVVHGKIQTTFWLLVTSQPHEIGQAIAMKYDSILHVKGFSCSSAGKFLKKITKGNEELEKRVRKKEYLPKIENREENGMNFSGYFSPFLIHCVVLIAADPHQEFPDTPTGFYMTLIKAILVKQSKTMSVAERDKALRYSSKLAYEGLLKFRMPVVEARVTQDDNIFKLGLLSGYDKGNIFSSKVQRKINFIHPSVQYFLAAFHIVDQLSNGNVQPLQNYLIDDSKCLSQFLIGKASFHYRIQVSGILILYIIFNILIFKNAKSNSCQNCCHQDSCQMGMSNHYKITL